MLVFLQVVSRARMSDDIDILALANFCLAIQLGRMATELQVNRKFTYTLIFYYFHVTSLPVHHVCSTAAREQWQGTKLWKPCPLWVAWRLPFLLMSWSKQRLHHFFTEADAEHQQLTKWKLSLQDSPAVISFKEKATSSKMADQNHDFIMTGSFKSFTVLL